MSGSLVVAKIKIADRITYSIGLQSSGAYAIRQRRNAIGERGASLKNGRFVIMLLSQHDYSHDYIAIVN
jgi:hypothetical protein